MEAHAIKPHIVNSDKVSSVDVSVTEIAPQMELSGLTIHEPLHSPESIDTLGVPSHKHSHTKKKSPRSPSPTGSARSVFSSSYSSRRHVTRRISGGIIRSHRSEVSKELAVQAESEFFALMELMTSISRRSISLKEVWNRLISERESYMLEMDKMYERFEEYEEIITRAEKEKHTHTHEHEERKKEISQLRLEISAMTASITEYKKKLTDRDTELGNARRELHEYKETATRTREEHEETRKTLEEIRLSLIACEEERNHARGDAEKHHGDLRALNQKYVELQSSFAEITEKHESTHKEVISLRQSNSIFKKEKHEWLSEKGEMEESLRKCNHKCHDLSHKLEEVTEKYEKKVREVHKLKESISTLEYEKEEFHQRVEELKRKCEEKHSKWEDAEERCGKWKLKWEQSEREIVSIREELRLVEIEKTELHETITKTREELRLLIIEKERVCEDYHHECKRSEEHHRKIIVLQESLRRIETTLKEKTEIVHSLTERIERIKCERDEARGKCADLTIEIEQFQASISILKAEIITITKKHDGVCEKLRECEARYEEVCESVTEYNEGHNELEYEMTNLRSMLREAREQKEKAIKARNLADIERDEANVRYEEKCRELERFEEQLSQHFHAHGKSDSRRTTTRHFHKVVGSEMTNGYDDVE